MKRIEAIIRPAKVGDVLAALAKVGHPGVMVSEVEGHGSQMGVEHQVRGKTYKVPLLAKKKIDVVVKDAEAAKIIEAIQKAVATGEIGDGKIFVSSMEDAIRIRTGESGEKAV
ncbi:MAG: P-II family nitrogen regulator [Nitrospiraceae bacterium]|nr:P-II family nitrogen regulator [Nitrospiraceae bacterium]